MTSCNKYSFQVSFFFSIGRILFKTINESSGILRLILRFMTAPIPRINILLVKIQKSWSRPLYDLAKVYNWFFNH